MKRPLLFLVFALLFIINAHSQSYVGEIYFHDQQQIDSFSVDYPGISRISESVYVVGSFINNLNGLASLSYIGGDLYVGYGLDIGFPQITSLDGLHNLDTIVGGFTIEFCEYLENIDALAGVHQLQYVRINYCNNLQHINGLQGVSGEILGIDIFENESLESVTGLLNINVVQGTLRIAACPNLNSLLGLHNVVGTGPVQILGNSKLTSLQGLNKLQSVGGLSISNNSLLFSLEGLNRLKHASGFYLTGNSALYNCSGLDSLLSAWALNISENESLTSLDGLNSLVADSLTFIKITDNTLLEACSFGGVCDYLDDPTGAVIIYNNAEGCNTPPQVAKGCGINLDCLPYGHYYFYTQAAIDSFQVDYSNCSSIYGGATIQGNEITNLTGLSNLTSIQGNLYIQPPYNDSMELVSLVGLHNLERINGTLYIRNNHKLLNLNGLNSLNRIDGDFRIMENRQLISLAGTSNLERVDGTIEISSNDSLHYIVGMSNLKHARSLTVRWNDKLKNLEGMEALELISSYMNIMNNSNLEGLAHFDNLKEIRGSMHISNNPLLDDLSGLDKLEYIPLLAFHYNESLTALPAMDKLDYKDIDHIYISNNPLLSSCQNGLICEMLANEPNRIDIANNGAGCSDNFQVEDSCDVGIDEEVLQTTLRIYPNPASGQVYISGLDPDGEYRITIYNHLGQKIQSTDMINNQIDVSGLKKGMYMLAIRSDNLNEFIKIIKH